MTSGFNSSNNPPAPKSKALSVANANALTSRISSIFGEIEDPRVERNRVHLLTDILIIAILSVIAGAKGWEDMENYGLSKYEWLEQFLTLLEGIPSADTFRRVCECISRPFSHTLNISTNRVTLIISDRIRLRLATRNIMP